MLTKLFRYPRIIYMLAFYLLIEQANSGFLSAWRFGIGFSSDWQPIPKIVITPPCYPALNALLADCACPQLSLLIFCKSNS